jgi:hypothetical protein
MDALIVLVAPIALIVLFDLLAVLAGADSRDLRPDGPAVADAFGGRWGIDR